MASCSLLPKPIAFLSVIAWSKIMLVNAVAESDQKIREQHQWLFSFHAFHAGLSL